MILMRYAIILWDISFKNTFLFFCSLFISCGNGTQALSQDINTPKKDTSTTKEVTQKQPIVGANQTEAYLPLLANKNIGIVGNQTSVIFKSKSTEPSVSYTHLIDSLLARNVQIKKVYAPEHGFRGKADAAELVKDGKDKKTGLPIISLYGKNKKPSASALSGIDLMIFDIQDVGVRFYTYISTLHYVMQSCAELDIPLLILDRPNPNGHYIDGPTLDPAHSSFVGMHPIPLVHGMTIGEYAKMINGQGWLGNDLKCKITVIPVKHYTHQTAYSTPIRPSPNLPNDQSIQLYPSLGFFEGTTINAGRGTEMQFQIFGSPELTGAYFDFNYTPKPNFGAKHPKHDGVKCIGKDLRKVPAQNRVQLEWLVEAYTGCKNKSSFFKPKSFTIHAGSPTLQQQIEQGLTAREIRKTWLKDLAAFKKIRAHYLIYK